MSVDPAIELGLSTNGSRGLLISFEALDKTPRKQIMDKVCEKLSPQDSMCFHFPQTATAIGGVIDGYLRKKVLYSPQCAPLLFAAGIWEWASSLEKSVREGTHVLLDRYTLSNTVYTVARLGRPYLDYCRHSARYLPIPDLTIYLQMEPEKLMLSPGYGTGINHSLPFLQRVDALFQELVHESRTCHLVSCTGRSDEQVAEVCYELISGVALPPQQPLGKYDISTAGPSMVSDQWGIPY